MESKIDYNFNIPLIYNLQQKITNFSKEYLFTSRQSNPFNKDSDPEVEFTLFYKDKIYSKIYTYKDFIDYKDKMGFEGTWKSFFELLSKSIQRISNGDIKVNACQDSKESIKLTLIHPIDKDIQISSEMELNKVNYKNNNEYYLNGLYGMYDKINMLNLKIKNLEETNNLLLVNNNNNSKVNGKGISVPKIKKNKCISNKEAKDGSSLSTSESNNISTNNSMNLNIGIGVIEGDNVGNDNNNNNKLDSNHNQKRKYNANLINPNIKKRKNKGCVFQSDDEK